jgi:hypothetical protein
MTHRGNALRAEIAAAAASAAGFFTIGMLALGRAHPDDDAFILFRYAQHVARGEGIVFNASGPHAEGATDFLWMLLLSGLTALGVDVAVAAVALNAVGAGFAAFVLARALGVSSLPRPQRALWVALLPASVLMLSAATAAYGGFSSMLYAALVLVALHASLEASPRAIAWVPLLGLGLGLFRPDGALVGIAVGVLGAVRARDLSRLRSYAVTSCAAVASGGLYYAWRLSYFGLALPLPLYVKSRTGDVEKLALLPEPLKTIFSKLPGLGANLHWVIAGGTLGAIAVVVVSTILLRRLAPQLRWGRIVLAALPLYVLWGSLCVAYQSQNIDWRYQAPIQLGAAYFALRGVSALRRRGLVSWRNATVMAGATALGVIATGVPNVVTRLRGDRVDCIHTFAARYGRGLASHTRIALTEAGRLPFWSSADVLDTIGLNSPETALRPVSRKLLTDFDPHVLFFHHDATLDLRPLAGPDPIAHVQSLRAFVRPEYRERFERDYAAYSEVDVSSVRLAPLVMAHYLEDNLDRYEVVAVDVTRDRTYSMVFGFRKDTDVDGALALLRDSLRDDEAPSYLALVREGRALAPLPSSVSSSAARSAAR